MTDVHTTVTQRVPPGDPELEVAVLGAAVLDGQAARRIAAELDAADFLLDGHRIIFGHLRALVADGHDVDLILLRRALVETRTLDAAGGLEKLAHLAEAGASALRLDEYLRRLRADAAKRQCIAIAADLTERAYNGAGAAGLIADASRGLAQARERVQPAAGPVEVRAIATSLARSPDDLRIEYLWPCYAPTRSLIAVSAMPGTGKGKLAQGLLTARALDRAFPGIAPQPGPGLFWSAEQGTDEDDRVWQAFARGFGASGADYLAPLVTISDPRRNLSDPAVRDLLVELALKHPDMLMIFDSLRRVMPGDELSSELPDLFFREVFLPLRAAGATVMLLAHPPKPPAQGDLRAESLIRGSGDWLAIIDSFVVLKPAGRVLVEPGIEEIHATVTHVKARRGSKAEGGTLTIRVEHDGAPDVSFSLRLDADGAGVVTKAQLALEELAGFFRERGVAARAEYLAAFEGRFSKRQLDPARKLLVAQGLLRLLNPGEQQRSHCWRWTEDGSTAPDGDLFAAGTPPVHDGVHDADEDD